MNEPFQIATLILAIVVTCVAAGSALAGRRKNITTQTSADLLFPTEPQPHIWKIDRLSFIAMLVGAVIYAVICYAANHWDANVSTLWFYALPSAVILFFSVTGGPWVGSFVGVGGTLLIHIIYRDASLLAIDLILGAIAGFVSGLSLLFTRGKFDNLRSFIAVEIIAVLTFFLNDVYFVLAIQAQLGERSTLNFASLLPDYLAILILLTIVLILYDKSVSLEN